MNKLLALDLTPEGALSNIKDVGLKGVPSSFPLAVGSIINIALSLAGLICVAFFILAGYKYMTGEKKNIEDAKNIIKNTIIGLIIIVLSYSISTFVFSQLTASPSPTAATEVTQ